MGGLFGASRLAVRLQLDLVELAEAVARVIDSPPPCVRAGEDFYGFVAASLSIFSTRRLTRMMRSRKTLARRSSAFGRSSLMPQLTPIIAGHDECHVSAPPEAIAAAAAVAARWWPDRALPARISTAPVAATTDTVVGDRSAHGCHDSSVFLVG